MEHWEKSGLKVTSEDVVFKTQFKNTFTFHGKVMFRSSDIQFFIFLTISSTSKV